MELYIYQTFVEKRRHCSRLGFKSDRLNLLSTPITSTLHAYALGNIYVYINHLLSILNIRLRNEECLLSFRYMSFSFFTPNENKKQQIEQHESVHFMRSLMRHLFSSDNRKRTKAAFASWPSL